MRSINLNLLQLISTAVASGALTVNEINAAVQDKPRGLSYPCGFAKDVHGQFYSVFFATDKEDQTQVTRSKPEQEGGRGLRVKFNIRANKPKQQAAQTPGQALPTGAPAGTPQLTPEQFAGLAAVLQTAGVLSTPAVRGPIVRQPPLPTHIGLDPDTDIPF